jgi:hypothetical protein
MDGTVAAPYGAYEIVSRPQYAENFWVAQRFTAAIEPEK